MSVVVWVQTQKLYGRVANSYVWADLYLSAVIDINWVCRGLFCVATTRNVGQDLATFGDVGDMSATRRRHVELSNKISCGKLLNMHPWWWCNDRCWYTSESSDDVRWYYTCHVMITIQCHTVQFLPALFGRRESFSCKAKRRSAWLCGQVMPPVPLVLVTSYPLHPARRQM